ncbi:MAG TPA: hypothetical protein DDY31_08985, partial [Lachnospiraceae bacterium]|nr:hypothetical protein [Lachnospiraceae bacterium]
MPFASTSSADTDSDLFSQFSTISREYDTTNGGLLRYHYVDENGEDVDLSNSSNAENTIFSFKKSADIPSSYDL